MEIKHRQRITIMDGLVITFAEGFDEDGRTSFGPFEISASRNAVVVHRASLVNDGLTWESFKETMLTAFAVQKALAGGMFQYLPVAGKCDVCGRDDCIVHALRQSASKTRCKFCGIDVPQTSDGWVPLLPSSGVSCGAPNCVPH
jgi:hypothetical protein